MTFYDSHGKAIAYLHDDGIHIYLFNGRPVAYLYGDYSYTDKLKETEEEAKENKVGMYSDVDNSYYTTNKNNENSKTNLDEELEDKIYNKVMNTLSKFVKKILREIF